jgi:ABC-2 type transport system ATP-binding protein
MNALAVEVQRLSKAFRRPAGWKDLVRGRRGPRKLALDKIDLRVERGEIFGVLGPNGAGKTTLIKILNGIVLPDSGSARVNGFDVTRDFAAARPTMNMVYGDERSFYWRLSLVENLRFFARMYGLSGAAGKRRVDELIDLVDLTEAGLTRMHYFSSGMKQRAAIARGLINDPDLVFMDEPSRTLDPIGAEDLHRLIRERVADGRRTVVIATNLMTEAESLCHRLMVVDQGVNVMTGTVGEFRDQIGGEAIYRLRVSAHDVEWSAGVHGLPEVLRAVISESGEGLYDIEIATRGTSQALPRLVRYLVENGAEVRMVSKQEPTLEDIFRKVIRQRRSNPLAVVAS